MLKARIVTALILLAGFLALLFLLPSAGWMLLAAAVAALGAWEWAGLVKLAGWRRLGYGLACGAVCLALGWSVFDPQSGKVFRAEPLSVVFLLAGAFWLLAVPLWLRTRWAVSGAASGLLAGFAVMLPACLALMQLRAFSPLFLLAVMACVWAADIFAYACGRAFGRHKLAPSISPGKTWEGVAGAIIGVWLYGTAVAWAAGKLPATPAGWLLFSVALFALTLISILGDLFESMIKRQAGVKDSGSLLPGHGGALDRIDSLTSTLPFVGLAVLAWEGGAQ